MTRKELLLMVPVGLGIFGVLCLLSLLLFQWGG